MSKIISGTIRIMADFNVRKVEGAVSVNAVHSVNISDVLTAENTGAIWTISGELDETETVTYDTQDESLSDVFGDSVKVDEISSVAIVNESSDSDLTCQLTDIRGVGQHTVVELGPGGSFAISIPDYPAGGGELSGITLTGTDGGGYTILVTGKANI